MKHSITLLLFLFCLAGNSVGAENSAVVQYSSYTGLLQRLFDGFVSYEEALETGDQGIGTTDGLNGEVTILEGIPYRVNYDGKVDRVSPEEISPYITLSTAPEAEAIEITLPAGTSYSTLTKTVCEQMGDRFQKNFPHAIRITGTFAKVTTRSVPKLEKPYPALTAVTEKQHVFQFADRDFVLVGFWYPRYAQAFNPPEWHIHGLTSDKEAGGHVLNFETAENVKIQLWKKTTFIIHQPDTQAFAETDFDADMSAAVKKVNRN
jgi:acetolactate decarboxylase